MSFLVFFCTFQNHNIIKKYRLGGTFYHQISHYIRSCYYDRAEKSWALYDYHHNHYHNVCHIHNHCLTLHCRCYYSIPYYCKVCGRHIRFYRNLHRYSYCFCCHNNKLVTVKINNSYVISLFTCF